MPPWHFADEHDIVELSLDFISRRGYEPADEKAAWFPAQVNHNSGFYCRECGHEPFVDPSPHGDARRLSFPRIQDPTLDQRLIGLNPKEQAVLLEAVSRGELNEIIASQNRSVVKAISRARLANRRPRQEQIVRDATKRLLLRKVAEAHGSPTRAVQQLARLAVANPRKFTQVVGNEIPGLEKARYPTILEYLQRDPRRYITYGERQLWNLWSEIQADERVTDEHQPT